MADEYAHRFQRDYDIIWWIRPRTDLQFRARTRFAKAPGTRPSPVPALHRARQAPGLAAESALALHIAAPGAQAPLFHRARNSESCGDGPPTPQQAPAAHAAHRHHLLLVQGDTLPIVGPRSPNAPYHAYEETPTTADTDPTPGTRFVDAMPATLQADQHRGRHRWDLSQRSEGQLAEPRGDLVEAGARSRAAMGSRARRRAVAASPAHRLLVQARAARTEAARMRSTQRSTALCRTDRKTAGSGSGAAGAAGRTGHAAGPRSGPGTAAGPPDRRRRHGAGELGSKAVAP